MNWVYFLAFFRNGGGDEESSITKCWAHCWGEEFIISRVQKCNWCEESIMANNFEYRTERGEQRCRGEIGNDSAVPIDLIYIDI